MTYDTTPDKQNRIKIEWNRGRTANARTESEKVAVYDDTTKEDYLQTLAEYKEILINYLYLQQDDKTTTACRSFKGCFKGTAKNSCSRAVAGTNNRVIDTNERLNEVVTETTDAIIGTNAYDNQIE